MRGVTWQRIVYDDEPKAHHVGNRDGADAEMGSVAETVFRRRQELRELDGELAVVVTAGHERRSCHAIAIDCAGVEAAVKDVFRFDSDHEPR